MSRKLAIPVAVAILVAGILWANAPISPLPVGTKADLLVVNKAERQLLAYSRGSLLRSYRVSLGREPVGTKERQGDRRTPEGNYLIDSHNPTSAFHRALHVSYPSAADVARAKVGDYEPGGEIMVHGIRNGLGWKSTSLGQLDDWVYCGDGSRDRGVVSYCPGRDAN